MKAVRNISFLNFIAALHYFLTIYILSPYLAQFMGEKSIGLVFAAGAFVSLAIFFSAPHLLKRMPLKWATLGVSTGLILVLTGLAFEPPVLILVPLVIFLLALPSLLGYTLDVFLEKAVTSEEKTGTARGLFITATGVAVISSPIVLSVVLGDTNAYWKIFAISGATLALFVLVSLFKLDKDTHVITQEDLGLVSVLSCLLHSRNVVLGAAAHFMLQIFFTWVTIYIPLYLHTELGIPWSELGFVFFLMLLPFILLEFPVGYIADKYLGEKELMVLGFIITSGAMMSISFFDAGVVSGLLIFALIMTRVGAALLEITTETYFFKHVSSSDITTISLFRMLRPGSSLVAPLIGSVVLIFVSLQWIFVVLGSLILLGIPFALALKDTR